MSSVLTFFLLNAVTNRSKFHRLPTTNSVDKKTPKGILAVTKNKHACRATSCITTREVMMDIQKSDLGSEIFNDHIGLELKLLNPIYSSSL